MLSMLIPRVRRVRVRIRAWNRDIALGAIRRFGCFPFVKLNPRNFRSHDRATALFSRFTFRPSHQALACSPAAYIDVAVVRTPNEGRASSLQLTIKLIKNKIR
jgi:hypothetical protein